MGLDTGAFHSGRILTRRTVRSSPRRRSAVGHSHSCASSVPAYPAVARGPAYGVSERLGDMTAPLVFLGVDVLHWSEARRCVRRDNARALRQRCRLGFYPLNRSAEVFLRWLRCDDPHREPEFFESAGASGGRLCGDDDWSLGGHRVIVGQSPDMKGRR